MLPLTRTPLTQLAALSPILHASPPRWVEGTVWLAGTLGVQGLMQGLEGFIATDFDLEGSKRQQLLPYPSLFPQLADHP